MYIKDFTDVKVRYHVKETSNARIFAVSLVFAAGVSALVLGLGALSPSIFTWPRGDLAKGLFSGGVVLIAGSVAYYAFAYYKHSRFKRVAQEYDFKKDPYLESDCVGGLEGLRLFDGDQIKLLKFETRDSGKQYMLLFSEFMRTQHADNPPPRRELHIYENPARRERHIKKLEARIKQIKANGDAVYAKILVKKLKEIGAT